MTWICYYMLFAAQLRQTLFYMKLKEISFESSRAINGTTDNSNSDISTATPVLSSAEF